MALNFPDSPVNGEIFFDEDSQFYYSWNEQYGTWTSRSPSSARGIKVIDDISDQFDGVETVFPLSSSGATISPTTTKQILVSLDGLDQVPDVDYTVDGTIIIFTVAPTNGLEFSAINIGSSFPVISSELRCVNNSHESLDHFPVFVDPDGANGNPSEARVSTTKLKFNPTTGELFSTKLSGSGEGITNVSISGIDLSGDSTFTNIIATDVSVSSINSANITVTNDITVGRDITATGDISGGNIEASQSITTQSNIIASGDISSGGTISDSHGPLRRLTINNQSDDYTLVSADAGKLIRQSSDGKTITIPANTLDDGDMVTIFNVSGGFIAIDGSAVTMYNTADGDTGNRLLAAKGVSTLACTAANEFIISGSGLS